MLRLAFDPDHDSRYDEQDEQPIVSPQQGRWAMGVLSLMIDVVRPTSVLGLILAQARSEIESLVVEPASSQRHAA